MLWKQNANNDNSDVLTAHYGDWLVEDDNGNWHVESEEQH